MESEQGEPEKIMILYSVAYKSVISVKDQDVLKSNLRPFLPINVYAVDAKTPEFYKKHRQILEKSNYASNGKLQKEITNMMN